MKTEYNKRRRYKARGKITVRYDSIREEKKAEIRQGKTRLCKTTGDKI